MTALPCPACGGALQYKHTLHPRIGIRVEMEFECMHCNAEQALLLGQEKFGAALRWRDGSEVRVDGFAVTCPPKPAPKPDNGGVRATQVEVMKKLSGHVLAWRDTPETRLANDLIGVLDELGWRLAPMESDQ